MSRTSMRKMVLCAAAGLACAQVAAALCGCIKKEPPLVEATPVLVAGWADPEVLAKHHPLWVQFEQMYATAEGAAYPAPESALPPPDMPAEYALEPEPLERTDLDEWRNMARSALRGPEAVPEGPEQAASVQAALEAEAMLSSRREAVSKKAEAEARQAERRIARERFDHSLTTRDARVTADLGPAGASPSTSEQIRGDLDRWTERRAREEEARIRAEAARALRAAELERDAELLEAAIKTRQRREASTFDLAREREEVSRFMQDVDRPAEDRAVLDTGRMARRERDLAAEMNDARSRLSAAAESGRQATRETLDQLRERLVDDTRRMAYSLARAEGIELAFTPGPGRTDVTQQVAAMLDRAYTTPDIEVEDLSPPAEPDES